MGPRLSLNLESRAAVFEIQGLAFTKPRISCKIAQLRREFSLNLESRAEPYGPAPRFSHNRIFHARACGWNSRGARRRGYAWGARGARRRGYAWGASAGARRRVDAGDARGGGASAGFAHAPASVDRKGTQGPSRTRPTPRVGPSRTRSTPRARPLAHEVNSARKVPRTRRG